LFKKTCIRGALVHGLVRSLKDGVDHEKREWGRIVLIAGDVHRAIGALRHQRGAGAAYIPRSLAHTCDLVEHVCHDDFVKSEHRGSGNSLHLSQVFVRNGLDHRGNQGGRDVLVHQEGLDQGEQVANSVFFLGHQRSPAILTEQTLRERTEDRKRRGEERKEGGKEGKEKKGERREEK